MEQVAALFSLVCMMAFVALFDLRRHRQKLVRLWSSVTLMSVDELEQIRTIWSACGEM
jgi:hypothetical protein